MRLRGTLRGLGWKRGLLATVTGAVGLVALSQAVPYGRAHDNPPVVAEPSWNNARTRQLAVRACFDCHSNETTWPWYANVAPMSWLVQHDVDSGRATLNFSEWNRPQEAALEAADSVAGGEMPPRQYTVIHGSLSKADRAQLAAGLGATIGGSQGGG